MEEKQDKNWLEWIVLGISSLLVLSVIGLLVYNAVTVPDTPPIIKVSLGQLEQQEGYFVVPLVAVNKGFQTAKNVRIEVVAASQNDQEEKAAVEFPYLPGQSKANGWATFVKDPGDPADLQIQIVGYITP